MGILARCIYGGRVGHWLRRGRTEALTYPTAVWLAERRLATPAKVKPIFWYCDLTISE